MKKRKVISISLIAGLLIGGLSYGAGPSDLSGHWSKHQVESLISKGIIDGYPDGTFRPDIAISREEASKLISKYIGKTGGSSARLNDIEGRWSAEYIEHLVSENIVQGYPDGAFRPEQRMTRAEFVAMVYKYLSKEGVSLEPSKDSFKDIGGHWAGAEIIKLSSNGYLKGYPDGTFRPNSPITRAEVSAVISLMEGGGLKLPAIETPWSKSHEDNMQTMVDELGFKSDGSGDWDMVESLENPIGVYQNRPDQYEAEIVVRAWQVDGVADSYRIPWVFDQLLKFYFGDDAELVYQKLDDLEAEEFRTTDRFVKVRDDNGQLKIYIGHKGLKQFSKWW